MTEWRLFPEGTVPEHATAAWYAGRAAAHHVDEPLHRPRMFAAVAGVSRLVKQHGYRTVVDLGAGDGGMLDLVAFYGVAGHGYDVSPAAVDHARRNRHVDVELRDVVADPPPGRWADIAIATEFLEHLVDPHRFLAELAHEQRVDALVASSPWTETGDHAYEFHLWAWDQDGYRALLEGAGWQVVDTQLVGMFQVVTASRGAQ